MKNTHQLTGYTSIHLLAKTIIYISKSAEPGWIDDSCRQCQQIAESEQKESACAHFGQI